MHFRALALAMLLAAAALAGCTRAPEETRIDTNASVTPPTNGGSSASGARFVVSQLVILTLDGRPVQLHEDDGGALIRYTVREPDDAPRAETAFITYSLNGRIVDIQQLKLEPGEEKTFERRVGDLRENRTIKVEVRAAASVVKAEATVLDWPRAGDGALTLGPLQIRADYGFMEQDGRVLINFTLANEGPDVPIRDFRAKMLCALPNGTIRLTSSVRLDAPTAGNRTGVDALLDNCDTDTPYGVEFKARAGEEDVVGRMLLVPVGWRPAPPP